MFLILRFAGIAILIPTILLSLHVPPAFAQDASRGQAYTGPNRMVSLVVPKAPNFAGVPYKVTPLDTKGDRHYDKVMLHADDFGQYLVVGVRVMPPPAVAQMDRDQPDVVLKNLSEATLMGWRTDFGALPDVAEESLRDSKHGSGIIRVYRAKKGSILVRAQGRRPSRDDAFDTNIASVVARRGAIVVFVVAQNDASPDDAKSLVKIATDLFDDLRVAAVR
jgi:hypothetical protein